jgi:PAS domain S-box-containing protein
LSARTGAFTWRSAGTEIQKYGGRQQNYYNGCPFKSNERLWTDMRSCKVLLVDDEPANLLALEAILGDLPCDAVRCSSGEDALRELLRDTYAVVLLDLQMPTLGGTEVARLIRAREATRNVPIIFITAHDAAEVHIDEAYSVGAVDFLTKPVNPHILRSKVRFFVELHLKNQQLYDMEQKLHAAELRATLERTRILFENVKDLAFIEITTDGKIRMWGAGAQHITGWSEQEVVGLAIDILFTPEDVQINRPSFERQCALRTGRAPDKRWHMRKDGTRFFADGVMVAVYGDDREVKSFAKVFQDATSHVESELDRERLFKEAQAANTRLKDVFEQAPAFLCTLGGPAHVFEMANDRYYQLINRGPGIIGKTVRQVLPEVETQGFFELLDKVYETGEPFIGNGLPLSVRQQDGSFAVRIIDFVYVALRDADGLITGILAHGVDITAKKKLEQEARSADERYRKLIEALDEGFCLIQVIFNEQNSPVDYRFLEINPVFSEQSSLSPDCVGKTMRELVPDLDDVWIQRYGKVALTGEPTRFTEEAKVMNRWFDVYATRLGDNESRTVAVLFRDITAARRADDDLRRLAAELSESSRRKSEFLAVLAHELRNPLAPIRSGLEVMRLSADKPSSVARVREMMDRQVSHMVHLIDDLLDVARITSNKVDLNIHLVMLGDVIGPAVEASSHAVHAAQHQLVVDVPDPQVIIACDEVRMAQVIGNLLRNAAKYTPNGGQITISAIREADTVVIAVADNGVGIPSDALPFVFDMFSQVSRNLGRSQGGLGIGLSIVRQLVELHGGTVAVSSGGEGKGSRFQITLPIRDINVLPAVRARREAVAAEPHDGLAILVVDDNVDAASSLASLLELRGHSVRVAHDGLTALSFADEFRPEVVFLDIGMPGLTGHEVARAIREKELTMRTLLVAVTGWGTQDDLLRAQEAGFDHHITKPAQLSEIDKILATFAQNTRQS